MGIAEMGSWSVNRNRVICVGWFVCGLYAATVACASEPETDAFRGWQGLRVIKTPSGAAKICPLRISPEAPECLLLANTRQSRLELLHYVGPTSEDTQETAEVTEDPNFLPFAEDFERVEIPLPRLPLFATAVDLDGDGTDEILYVQDTPRELVALQRNGEIDQWEAFRRWEISEGDLTTPTPILVRPDAAGKPSEILLSFRDGIQIVSLTTDEVAWLQPRERNVARSRWWLADLDEDKDTDLIEGTDSTTAPIRWYEAEGESLRAAVNISTQVTRTNIARYLHTDFGPRMAFLGSVQANTLNLYKLDRGDASPMGKRNLLPLSQPDPKFWASIELEGARSLVELGAQKPILNLYQEIDGFWQFRESFPVLDDIVQVLALGDPAHTLLFQVTDEIHVFRSRWVDGRFSFPLPLPDPADLPPANKILGMGRDTEGVWWIEAAPKSIRLQFLARDADTPVTTVYADIEGEFEEAVWLGGTSLLLKKRFSQDTQRLVLDSATNAPVWKTARLKGADIARLQRAGEILYLLKDGVVQKLDQDLQVVDQIMLEGDHAISSFAPRDEASGFALDPSGEEIFVLEADDSGILREAARHEIPFAHSVAMDPVLGLTLISGNYINLPSAGQPRELIRLFSYDPTEDGLRTNEETNFSNLFVVDADGDGNDDLAAVDFAKRSINLYQVTPDGFNEMISWKVFDDGKYPYGDGGNQTNSGNPYRMIALDFDADGNQDLALASHDRLLIYLARDSDTQP